MDRQREEYRRPEHNQANTNTMISIADELSKLAKLKEQGIISESEFQEMKQDLLKKKA
jgi:hypothetical protein